MSDAPCRHGFHRGKCLAPACEHAQPPPRAPKSTPKSNAPREPDRLTADEAEEIRALIGTRGIAAVARSFGVDQITLARALALFATSKLTTHALRLGLARLTTSEAAAE